MPFCIIFFAILDIFMFCFGIKNVYKILGVLGLILAVICLFVSKVCIYDGVYINAVLVGLLLGCAVLFTIINSWKCGLQALVVSGAMALIYYIVLQIDLFVSLDYSILFAILICVLPVILCSKGVKQGLLVATNTTIFVMVYDSIFWYKELQYIDINDINVLNMLAVLYVVAIVAGVIRSGLSKKLVGDRYESKVQ